jgi:transposase InsO family protein
VADTSISGRRVARELDAIIAWRGKPTTIISDNGTELTSNAILEWAQLRQVGWHYIAPADYARALSGNAGRRAANPDHFARRPLASGEHPGANQSRTLVMAG